MKPAPANLQDLFLDSLRALDYLPKSGSRAPWRLKQNYLLDLQLIRRGKVDDEALAFSRHRAPVNSTSA